MEGTILCFANTSLPKAFRDMATTKQPAQIASVRNVLLKDSKVMDFVESRKEMLNPRKMVYTHSSGEESEKNISPLDALENRYIIIAYTHI